MDKDYKMGYVLNVDSMKASKRLSVSTHKKIEGNILILNHAGVCGACFLNTKTMKTSRWFQFESYNKIGGNMLVLKNQQTYKDTLFLNTEIMKDSEWFKKYEKLGYKSVLLIDQNKQRHFFNLRTFKKVTPTFFKEFEQHESIVFLRSPYETWAILDLNTMVISPWKKLKKLNK